MVMLGVHLYRHELTVAVPSVFKVNRRESTSMVTPLAAIPLNSIKTVRIKVFFIGLIINFIDVSGLLRLRR